MSSLDLLAHAIRMSVSDTKECLLNLNVFLIHSNFGNVKFHVPCFRYVSASAFRRCIKSVRFNILPFLNLKFEYVSDYSSTDLSFGYKLAGVWAGRDGTLLIWTWATSFTFPFH